MKEVSCNHAEECGYWCHAASPHQVTEICERDYCREARRQVQCEPVEEPAPVTAPPDTCTRRVLGICDLSGIACAVVYDGVTCRRGRPRSAAEVAESDVEEHRYEDARQVWAESQGADDLDKFRALAHDRDTKQRKVWHAFGHPTYRGIPVVKTDYLVPEAPATITARVYEESIRGIIFEAMRDGSRTGNLGKANRAVARIMKLPRIRQEGGTGE